MYNPTPHFMSLYTVVNELRMRRALSLALMQSHSVRVASWRKDCDWRALSNYPLQSVGSSRAFLPSPHCPPSCKRLLGDGCRQRGTSVISIRVFFFFLSVFSNIRICPSRYGWVQMREGGEKGGRAHYFQVRQMWVRKSTAVQFRLPLYSLGWLRFVSLHQTNK